MSLQALECSKHFVTTSNMPQIKGISGNLSITNRLNGISLSINLIDFKWISIWFDWFRFYTNIFVYIKFIYPATSDWLEVIVWKLMVFVDDN